VRRDIENREPIRRIRVAAPRAARIGRRSSWCLSGLSGKKGADSVPGRLHADHVIRRDAVSRGVLRFSLHAAAGVNLFVGLFTTGLGAYRRLGQSAISSDAVTLAAIMGVASLAGAAFGVTRRHHLEVHRLGVIVPTYLIVVGVWMLYESFAHAEHVLMNPDGPARWILATVVAFVIALLYLFATPIVEAGTASESPRQAPRIPMCCRAGAARRSGRSCRRPPRNAPVERRARRCQRLGQPSGDVQPGDDRQARDDP
jgi:hypothetical protein